MKTIYQTPDIGQMTVIKSVLESSGIECILLDEYSQIIRPSTLTFSGGGRLAVADEKEEDARAIIEDYLKTVDSPEKNTEPEDKGPLKEKSKDKCPECGSEDFAPDFWSVFFGGNKYKCGKCGVKFIL